MSSHRSYFAEEDVYAANDATQLGEGAGPNCCGIELRGWRVLTRCCPMSNEHDLCQLVQELTPPSDESSQPHESIVVRGNHMQLPEMLFGGNALQLQHPASGLVLHFCAARALRDWVNMHIDGPVEQQDTTNTTTTTTTTTTSSSSAPHDDGGLIDISSAAQHTTLDWQRCDASGIDVAMLQDSAAPILFFDEVTLFEDFIHDAGEVRLSAKVRVMPRCWYVLLRYWLRVDGITLKIADARYFHKFGAADVHREVSVLQLPFEDVERRLPSATQACHLTADQAYPILKQAAVSMCINMTQACLPGPKDSGGVVYICLLYDVASCVVRNNSLLCFASGTLPPLLAVPVNCTAVTRCTLCVAAGALRWHTASRVAGNATVIYEALTLPTG
ncbi:TIP41-like family-domain-containing protein [Tribonema minus]|uniref:TIP41-like family-domain-containing protein n=1 Tax=Tribonema minus TaxID=303371 RepID=A0A836CMW7_9STRA|nr:TIP41-like family-domain-containing protein [Tribonema minus]